jgi:hypothetical protein
MQQEDCEQRALLGWTEVDHGTAGPRFGGTQYPEQHRPILELRPQCALYKDASPGVVRTAAMPSVGTQQIQRLIIARDLLAAQQ